MHSKMLEQTFLASHPFVPTRFQSHPHAHPLCSDLAVDLRFLPVRECSFNSPVSLSIYAICGKPGVVTTLYLVCICPIRSLCVSGGLDRDSAGGRSHP
jgi:hypothetical protein